MLIPVALAVATHHACGSIGTTSLSEENNTITAGKPLPVTLPAAIPVAPAGSIRVPSDAKVPSPLPINSLADD